MTFKKLFFLVIIIYSNATFTQTNQFNTLKMDCTQQFPKRESYVNQLRFIRKWASHATRIAFAINYDISDEQFENKKICFTNSGWEQYTQALHQSGNLNIIKKNQFQTNMMLRSVVNVTGDRFKQIWTIHVPIELAYQNQQTRIKQDLNVFMLVTVNAEGRLAIMQIIGKPVDLSKPETSPKKT